MLHQILTNPSFTRQHPSRIQTPCQVILTLHMMRSKRWFLDTTTNLFFARKATSNWVKKRIERNQRSVLLLQRTNLLIGNRRISKRVIGLNSRVGCITSFWRFITVISYWSTFVEQIKYSRAWLISWKVDRLSNVAVIIRKCRKNIIISIKFSSNFVWTSILHWILRNWPRTLNRGVTKLNKIIW